MKFEYKNKTSDYYKETRQDLIPFLPRNLKKILDVGCSDGNFGLMLKHKFNVDFVVGIEPFKPSADKASEKLDLVIHDSIENAFDKLVGQKYDCIFFNDVLEHLLDPYSILSKCKEFLTNDGLIFASIPNILYFDNIFSIIYERDFHYQEYGIMDMTHYRFFTKKSIMRMFSENGYKVESINGINSSIKQKIKFKLFSLMLPKKADDFKFVQFVVKASVK